MTEEQRLEDNEAFRKAAAITENEIPLMSDNIG